MVTTSPLQVEIWSDIACPWCFVGKRRLEHALQQFDSRPVALHWRAFQLDPGAPPSFPPSPSYTQRLAKKYGATEERAQAMIDQMTETGKAEGIQFNFKHIQAGNTAVAHGLLAWAKQQETAGTPGLQTLLKEQLFLAHFCLGADLSRDETLLSCTSAAGLDRDAAAVVLHTLRTSTATQPGLLADVRADQAQAARLGISGVPFFKIESFGVGGAQPPELLLKVLSRAVSELSAKDAPQCTPESCT